MKLNKTHISNSTKTSKPIFINHISISQYKQQIHEKEGFKLEIEWKKLKTHTFSWRLREDWRGKWRFCEWKWRFWERERRRRQRGLHVMRGKLKFFFKIVWDLTLFLQNTHFSQLIWLASKSPKWAAKIPCARFWKISLSLFHDWDFHSPVSHEPLWVTWRRDFHSQSNCENESRKWQKPRIFEKIS